MKRPNFFLVGAPKCGTTSLASWLKQHPQVFMCEPKEPYFFSTDIHSSRAAKTMQQYEDLFRGVSADHIIVGEASSTYLRSRAALPAILEYSPNAKFIVCLRNPVEMVASAHMQLFRGGVETERSLENAWNLQDVRRLGRDVPSTCMDPNNLLYGEICLLGLQVERLLNEVQRDQVMFVLLDDMRRAAPIVYQQVLRFLNILDDGYSNFSVENERKEPRWPYISQFTVHAQRIKKSLGIEKGTGLGRVVSALNNRPQQSKQKISKKFLKTLYDFYRPDIEKLSVLLDRDLSAWKA